MKTLLLLPLALCVFLSTGCEDPDVRIVNETLPVPRLERSTPSGAGQVEAVRVEGRITLTRLEDNHLIGVDLLLSQAECEDPEAAPAAYYNLLLRSMEPGELHFSVSVPMPRNQVVQIWARSRDRFQDVSTCSPEPIVYVSQLPPVQFWSNYVRRKPGVPFAFSGVIPGAAIGRSGVVSFYKSADCSGAVFTDVPLTPATADAPASFLTEPGILPPAQHGQWERYSATVRFDDGLTSVCQSESELLVVRADSQAPSAAALRLDLSSTPQAPTTLLFTASAELSEADADFTDRVDVHRLEVFKYPAAGPVPSCANPQGATLLASFELPEARMPGDRTFMGQFLDPSPSPYYMVRNCDAALNCACRTGISDPANQ